MFQSKKSKLTRGRQPQARLNESFRRNNVVVSRTQKEVIARQQSVTQRQLEAKRQFSRRRAKARLLFVVCIGLLIAIAWRFGITSVHVTADPAYKLTADQLKPYQTSLDQLYGSKTIARQSWLLDQPALAQAVTVQHPEVAAIDFVSKAPLSTQLQAKITFRKPVFIWTDASKRQQFIDNSGVLFDHNRDPQVDVKKLVHIEDQSGAVLAPGTSVITSQLIQFIGALHTSLPPLYNNAPIARIIVPKSTREVQVQMTGQPYIIKFSSERSTDQEVGELGTLLNFLRSKGVTPSSYIDMRLANKAFYK